MMRTAATTVFYAAALLTFAGIREVDFLPQAIVPTTQFEFALVAFALVASLGVLIASSLNRLSHEINTARLEEEAAANGLTARDPDVQRAAAKYFLSAASEHKRFFFSWLRREITSFAALSLTCAGLAWLCLSDVSLTIASTF